MIITYSGPCNKCGNQTVQELFDVGFIDRKYCASCSIRFLLKNVTGVMDR